MYWRLLGDPDTARQVVLAQKPVIADTGGSMEPSLLATLLANLSSLASVYHKPPEVGFLGSFHSSCPGILRALQHGGIPGWRLRVSMSSPSGLALPAVSLGMRARSHSQEGRKFCAPDGGSRLQGFGLGLGVTWAPTEHPIVQLNCCIQPLQHAQ